MSQLLCYQELNNQDFLELFCKMVAEDLMLLATLHDAEPDGILIRELKYQKFPSCLAWLSEAEAGRESAALIEHALSSLPDTPEKAILDELAADYAGIYLNHAIGVSPEESVWLDEDSLMCQESMFQVRGWYESYGLGIPDWRLRPDDHLVYELQFIAHMLTRDNRVETLGLAARFMDEHLLRWLGHFAERVIARCDTPYFAGIAAITAAYCEELRDILAEIVQEPRPSPEEIEERMQSKQQPINSIPVQFLPGMGPVV